jgi:ribonuclease PH
LEIIAKFEIMPNNKALISKTLDNHYHYEVGSPAMATRNPTQLRPIKIKPNAIKTADGSCEISFGHTRVICTAMWEDGVPPWKKGEGTGWVTGEYGMLPGSSPERIRREASKGKQSGRTQEIQRLIGRSLRTVTDFKALGENSIMVDCDVIQADGGTRTASITGGFVAMVLAMAKAKKKGLIKTIPVNDYVAAISVGYVKGKLWLDLDYERDSTADVDMNIVMTGEGKFIEVQGTAEKAAFSKKQLADMTDIAHKGIKQLITHQKKIIQKLTQLS